MKVLVSHESDDQVGREILSGVQGIEVLPYDPSKSTLTASQRGAEILIPPYRSSHRPIRLLGQLPDLRMVQLLSAGADEWSADVPSSVALATARGAHARPVSEWVLSAILALLRQWPTLVRFQDAHIWAHRKFHADTLSGKRALIVGAGHIGSAVAKLLTPFGATATLVASTARNGVRAASEIPRLVGNHEIMVITAPLTEATRNLVGKKLLASMPDGAILVNAGRGQIVDTDALVPELRAGRLRAALDVTEPEPLPADHPLWSSPGVIISPHSARTVPGTNVLCYQVAEQQIRTFIGGGVPSNLVARH